MPALLFNKTPLSVNFQASQGALVNANRLDLDFEIEVLAGAAAVVLWYLESTPARAPQPAPAWAWYRELSNDAGTGGVITMDQVVRQIRTAGGGALPVGIHRVSFDFEIRRQIVRLQASASAGNVRLTVLAPLSDLAR